MPFALPERVSVYSLGTLINLKNAIVASEESKIVIDASRLQSSYELRFGPDGNSLQWLLMGAQPEVLLSSEPEVTPFVEFRNMLLAPFVPEQLL